MKLTTVALGALAAVATLTGGANAQRPRLNNFDVVDVSKPVGPNTKFFDRRNSHPDYDWRNPHKKLDWSLYKDPPLYQRGLLNKRRLGGNWYLGHKGAKMPGAVKWTTSKAAEKSRMNRIVGPRDAIGTMIGGAVVNHFFDEMDDEDDLDDEMDSDQVVGRWLSTIRYSPKIICEGRCHRSYLHCLSMAGSPQFSRDDWYQRNARNCQAKKSSCISRKC